MSENRAGDAAFSLIELLVVMAIMAILIGLIVAGFNQISGAANLSNAGYMVNDQLVFARQTAQSRSRVVELRFYRVKGEDGQPAAYRALRPVLYPGDGASTEPLGRVQYLPKGIVLSPDERYSTLLSKANSHPVDGAVEKLPGTPAAPYKAILFGPTGETGLNPQGSPGGDKWDLTLLPEFGSPPVGGRPAKNFITLVLDPVNGKVKSFQP